MVIESEDEIEFLKVSKSEGDTFSVLVVNMPNLKELDCSGLRITKLDVSKCLELQALDCRDNLLVKLALQDLFIERVLYDYWVYVSLYDSEHGAVGNGAPGILPDHLKSLPNNS